LENLLKLYGELLPVMAFVLGGYLIRKKFDFKSDYVSKPLINVLLPLVVFTNMLDAEPTKLLTLPFVTFLLALSMNYLAIPVQKRLATDTDPLLLRSSFSFFNIAFFGIPIVKALFGEESVSVLICIYLGSALYGDTIGYYQVAKTKFSSKRARREMLSIPFLYVFVAGVICKILDLKTPEAVKPALSVVSFAVSAAGMFIVGLQLGDVDFKKIRLGYFAKVLGLRTLAASVIITLIILGVSVFAELEEDDLRMLALVPLFPVAANVTVFAAFLKADEEQSSLLVFLSMLISVVLVSVATLVMG
jgi:predicted permease